MPVEVVMPALSPTMEQGKIASWTVKEGDKVEAGDVLAGLGVACRVASIPHPLGQACRGQAFRGRFYSMFQMKSLKADVAPPLFLPKPG